MKGKKSVDSAKDLDSALSGLEPKRLAESAQATREMPESREILESAQDLDSARALESAGNVESTNRHCEDLKNPKQSTKDMQSAESKLAKNAESAINQNDNGLPRSSYALARKTNEVSFFSNDGKTIFFNVAESKKASFFSNDKNLDSSTPKSARDVDSANRHCEEAQPTKQSIKITQSEFFHESKEGTQSAESKLAENAESAQMDCFADKSTRKTNKVSFFSNGGKVESKSTKSADSAINQTDNGLPRRINAARNDKKTNFFGNDDKPKPASKPYTKLIIQLWKFLSRRKVLFLIYFVLPLLIAWFIYAVFMASLPRDLPVGVVDLDHSSASYELIYNANNLPAMKITRAYHSITEAKQDLATAKIYALIVIPYNYERDIKLKNGAKVALYYNAQFVLVGKSLNSAFAQVIGTLDATQWVATNLIEVENMTLAKAKAMPIFSQITALYNPSSNYTQFLLTLLLPCMLQILSALGMIHLLKSAPSTTKSLFIRYAFNSLVFVFWGTCMVMFLKNLGYETRGDIWILLFGIALLVCGVNGVVVFVQSVLGDFKATIGGVAVYTAPSLAFAGITYPQNSMNFLAYFWSNFLPISHFMNLYVQQANYGGGLDKAFQIIGGLGGFLLFFALGAGIYALKRTRA